MYQDITVSYKSILLIIDWGLFLLSLFEIMTRRKKADLFCQTGDVTFLILSTISSQAVTLISSFHYTSFFFKQL